jgi:hypothetical protein
LNTGAIRLPHTNEYPLLKSARREALVAFGIWLTATIYSVGYCCTFGYGRDQQTLTFVLGFPDWVFWGIVMPWGACTIVSSIFAFWFMKDEDLDGPTTAKVRI